MEIRGKILEDNKAKTVQLLRSLFHLRLRECRRWITERGMDLGCRVVDYSLQTITVRWHCDDFSSNSAIDTRDKRQIYRNNRSALK